MISKQITRPDIPPVVVRGNIQRGDRSRVNSWRFLRGNRFIAHPYTSDRLNSATRVHATFAIFFSRSFPSSSFRELVATPVSTGKLGFFKTGVRWICKVDGNKSRRDAKKPVRSVLRQKSDVRTFEFFFRRRGFGWVVLRFTQILRLVFLLPDQWIQSIYANSECRCDSSY